MTSTAFTFLDFTDLCGVFAGALFGHLLARRKGLDIVGMFFVSFMAAFGGGSLRDVLLDNNPLFWERHWHYTVLVFILNLAWGMSPRLLKSMERYINWPDTMGLAAFTMAGCATAYSFLPDKDFFNIVMFGVITGCFGGAICQLMCLEIPSIFRKGNPLYASCSFLGGCTYALLRKLGIDNAGAMSAGMGVVLALRIGALTWGWHLSSIFNQSESSGGTPQA